MLLLLTLLLVKHYIIDFPLQGPYQYLNKGTLGHLGGIQHALWHGWGTSLALLICSAAGMIFPIAVLFWVPVAESVAHYFIDYSKMNINKKKGWACNTHEQFWWLMGFDQLLHGLCYVGILYVAGAR